MKLMAVLLSAFLMGNAFAVNTGLKTALDELNYSLSVEWDQRDQSFYATKVEAFKKQILALKQEGSSDADLVKETLSLVRDEKAKSELKAAMSSLDHLSSAEAMNEIQKLSTKINAKGASWNGDILPMLVPGILIGALVVYIIATLATNNGENVPMEKKEAVYTCEYRDTCFSMWGPGNDDLGFPVGTPTCGYQFVCGYFEPMF